MKEKPFVRIHDEYINVQTIIKFEMKNGSRAMLLRLLLLGQRLRHCLSN